MQSKRLSFIISVALIFSALILGTANLASPLQAAPQPDQAGKSSGGSYFCFWAEQPTIPSLKQGCNETGVSCIAGFEPSPRCADFKTKLDCNGSPQGAIERTCKAIPVSVSPTPTTTSPGGTNPPGVGGPVGGTNPPGGTNPSNLSINNPLQFGTIPDILNAVSGFLYALALAFVTVMVLLGGFQILTAAGRPAQIDKGKQTLLWAVIGTVVILIAGGIAGIIKDILGGPA